MALPTVYIRFRRAQCQERRSLRQTVTSLKRLGSAPSRQAAATTTPTKFEQATHLVVWQPQQRV